MSDGWYINARGNLVKRYGPPHAPVARSSYPCPMLALDTMDPTMHVDGNTYTSKSQFRAVTKANGLTEVGNETAPQDRSVKAPTAESIDASLNKAVAEWTAGRRPTT